MSTRRWRVRRALVVALVASSVLGAPAAAQTSDGGDGGTGRVDGGDGAGTGGTGDGGPGEACCGPDTGTGGGTRDGIGRPGPPRTLTLDPAAGPPGTRLTVTGDGFGACLSLHDDVSPGAVDVAWDGSILATADVAGGVFSATVQVPDDAPPGTATVTGTCVGDPPVTAPADFTVTAPDRTADPATTGDAGEPGPAPGGTGEAAGDPTPATGTDRPVPSPQPADPSAVDASEAASRGDGPPAALIAALLAVLASAALLSVAVRRPRGPAWAAAHVSAVPGTATPGTVTVAPPPDGSPDATVVRLEPRSRTATRVLEEVDR